MNFRNFHKNRKLRFAISQTTQLDFGGGSQFRKQRNWVLEGVSQFRKQRNRVSSLFYNSGLENISYKLLKHSLVSDRTLSFSLFLLNWIIRATDKKCKKSFDDESDQNWSFYTTFNIYENAMIEKEKFAVMKPEKDDSEMTSNEEGDIAADQEFIDINESLITLLFKLYLKVNH